MLHIHPRLLSGSGVVIWVVPLAGIWCGGEYARDEDGDGFCEVHVNTMEGFWSLLRFWLRPHRGLS